MKKQKIILLIIILLLCIILVSIILNQNKNIKNKQITIKEMSESTQVLDLQTQINKLNASHTEYANYVQSYKETIATAITNQGVNTSADATAEVIAENIEKIFKTRTADATATADNITKGKTAYVNGNKITGMLANNGELNWNPTTSETYSVQAGYYSGGTLDSSEAYNAGVTAGKANSKNMITGSYVSTQDWYTTHTFSNLGFIPYAIMLSARGETNLSYKCYIYAIGSEVYYCTAHGDTSAPTVNYQSDSVSVYVPGGYFRNGATVDYIILSENCYK